MKFLIVGLKTNSQLRRLQEEGQNRGHQVDGCLTHEQFKFELEGKELKDYDLIYLWAIAKRRWEWALAASFLNKNYQTKIINQKIIAPDYLYFFSPALDYLKQTRTGINYPKSKVVFPQINLSKAIEGFSFPLIVKASGTRQGQGVYKLDSFEAFKSFWAGFKKETVALVIREFIPNEGDIRVFTIGYRAIGAMRRIPPEGEFRSNISQGGSGQPFDLKKNPRVRELAEKLSWLTKTEIAGVDIIFHQQTQKPYVLEINPGPQFTGFEKYTLINVALEIIKYFERKLKSPKSKGPKNR